MKFGVPVPHFQTVVPMPRYFQVYLGWIDVGVCAWSEVRADRHFRARRFRS